MFAVIETGGKQYRVQEGDVLDVELLPIEGKEREKIVFDRVLLVYGEGGTRVGNPVIPGARVEPSSSTPRAARRCGFSSTARASTSSVRAGTGRTTSRCASRASRSDSRLTRELRSDFDGT